MTAVVRPPVPESPCNRICAIDPPSGLCRGCGRTLAEISSWIAYDARERTRIMAELPQRLAALRHRNAPPAEKA